MAKLGYLWLVFGNSLFCKAGAVLFGPQRGGHSEAILAFALRCRGLFSALGLDVTPKTRQNCDQPIWMRGILPTCIVPIPSI